MSAHTALSDTWFELRATWVRLRVPYAENMVLELTGGWLTRFGIAIRAEGMSVSLSGFEDMGPVEDARRYLSIALMSANLIEVGQNARWDALR